MGKSLSAVTLKKNTILPQCSVWTPAKYTLVFSCVSRYTEQLWRQTSLAVWLGPDVEHQTPTPHRPTIEHSLSQLATVKICWELQPEINTSLQSCLTFCDPIDCSSPGSSIHGILQARMLAWVAMSYSKISSRPRDWTHIAYVFCIGRWVLYH